MAFLMRGGEQCREAEGRKKSETGIYHVMLSRIIYTYSERRRGEHNASIQANGRKVHISDFEEYYNNLLNLAISA